MADRKFQADVTFEVVERSRKWLTYKVSEKRRGHLGMFRLNTETGFCDDRDEAGQLTLGGYFSGTLSAQDFADRFELLTWIYEVFGTFLEEEEPPTYRFVST